MKTYTALTVRKFIYGEDTEIPVDELCDNASFMKEVLFATNDFRMYRLCSDRLKTDYEFVKFVILMFSNFKHNKDNIQFVENVAEEFLENYYSSEHEDVDIEFDFYVLLTKTIKKKDDPFYNMLTNSYINAAYNKGKEGIKLCKEDNPEEALSLGLGYRNVLEKYAEYDNALEYYAKAFLTEIFSRRNIDLEIDVHKKFKSPKDLEHGNIITYLINIIACKDQALAEYTMNHKYLLDKYYHLIRGKYLKDWHSFDERINQIKIREIYKRVHNYMMDVEDVSKLTGLELLYIIAIYNDFDNLLIKYDYIDKESSKELMTTINVEYVKSIINNNICDRINYNNVLSIVDEVLSCNNRYNLNQGRTEEKRGKVRARLIKYDFKNKAALK